MPKKRGGGNKKLKPVLHIYCEGEKSEPNYLNGYLRNAHPANRLLQVIKVEHTKKNTPVQLVQEAIDRKNDKSTPPEDIFWVVYDRESVSKYADSLHQKALDKANAKNVNVALTNVCFEVWLLLHFSDINAPYSSCSDLVGRSILRGELNKLGIQDYRKSDCNLFELIMDRVDDARRRAERMNRATLASSFNTEDKPYLLNPYTGVNKLLDAIDEFAANSSG